MSPAAAATSYLTTGAALSRARGIHLSLRAAPASYLATGAALSRARGIRLSLRAAPAPCRAVVSPVSAPRSSPAASSPERFDFVKYKGHDNIFIMVDNRDSSVPKVTSKLAITLCNRDTGFSADGVILAMPGVNGAGYIMKVFNSDGTELVVPKMSRNAACAFAWYMTDLENRRGTNSSKIHTGAGIIIPQIQNVGPVKVDMGEPILSRPDILTKLPATRNKAVVQAELEVEGSTWHVTCVKMGNLHCVTFGSKELMVLQVDDLELSEIGPKFEFHEMFPHCTNTEFVQVLTPSHLKVRVWERGAGATPACGAGACAAVVAAYLEGKAERKCIVDMPGGQLEIEWREDDNHVYMTVPPVRTAPAEAVMAQQGKSACPPGHGCGCGSDAICDKVEEIRCRVAARNDSRPICLEVLGIVMNPNLIVPLAGITMVATALSRGWVKIEPISSNLIVLLAGFTMLVMVVSRGWVKIEPISVTDILK